MIYHIHAIILDVNFVGKEAVHISVMICPTVLHVLYAILQDFRKKKGKTEVEGEKSK